jgi:uncharacterized membrane protein (DUF4010 family)
MTSFLSTEFTPFHHLLISLGLGLLVGLQREWAESPLAGIRSFALISLLGTVAALLAEQIGPWTIGLGFVGVIGIMLIGQFSIMRNGDQTKHYGIVSEVSALLVYSIGVLVHTGPVLLAASIAGILAVVLQVKLELHTFASRLDKNEIRSIMQFVLIVLVIFPIIPDQSFGPYNALNPQNIWMMVVLIVGISLIGYIIHKFFGNKAGVLLNGFLGGLVSSTATTITCSKSAKKSEATIPYNVLVILMAWATLYCRVFFELVVTAPGFSKPYIPLFIMTLVSLILILFLWRQNRYSTGVEIHSNPTELKTAISFAIMYALILLGTKYFKQEFGNEGLAFMALISGVANVDAVVLSTGRLVTSGGLSHEQGYSVILFAILSNNFFKGMLALAIGGAPFFRIIFLPWSISMLGVGLLLLF